MGGRVAQVTSYTTRDDTDFDLLARQISLHEPDAVYLVTQTPDLARICIQLRNQGHTMPILSDGGSVTASLIDQGGLAVEGIEFFQPFDLQKTSDRFQAFLKQYEDRFHIKPEMSALLGYEAAQILLNGLTHAQNRKDLSQTIRSLKVFEGLQHQITFNDDNVALRPLLHRTISNGRIVTVGSDYSQ